MIWNKERSINKNKIIDMKRIIGLLIFVLGFSVMFAENDEIQDDFFFDAVVFRGEPADSARVDVYVMVPYKSVEFKKTGQIYTAKFSVKISILDTTGGNIAGTDYNRLLTEQDYAVSRGSTSKFDIKQIRFRLAPGTYKIRVELNDENNKAEYAKARTLNVLNFNELPFALSGIMLVSSIEEADGKFKITPHLSDNIGNLRDGFFAFFESYSKDKYDSLEYVYEIIDKKGDVIRTGDPVRKYDTKDVNRIYLRIPRLPMSTSNYTLKVSALKAKDSMNYEESDLLAVAQRSIKSVQSIGGLVLGDLDKAIRQLRYVANNQEMDAFDNIEDVNVKTNMFEDFWKRRDPTPGTERNEAFDEYYTRIAYANKNFKSFTEGWLTDKGMVFIVFGTPNTSDRYTGYSDGRLYEKWTYMTNREFIFVDNSGFGDFRLVRPATVTEKYFYQP